jgi:molecular chaperone DnaK
MTTSSNSSPIIGIDLGTTNSVVAAIVEGQPQVLTERGEAILPSVVGLGPAGKMLVGETARNQLAVFPASTVASVKRRMGAMDPIKMGDQTFTPPEISAIILRRLRDRASAVLSTPVTRAVITVPAFFDENQRQATRQAGELAGLTVERIINEPTAATLVYHAGSDHRKHLIVYDFGGGTFDVSVVRIESGVVEVLSSRGDTNLGGDDLDAALLKHVADTFHDQHEIDLRKDAATRWRLARACEAAKCRLSSEESVTIAEEFITKKDNLPINLEVTVDRNQYQQMIAGMVERTIECVDEAVRESGLNLNGIDDLVLVGGSTRTPLVENRLREEFGLEPSRAVDPDLAVALGAAVQAAMISGETVGPVLVDVVTHTLGIEAMTGMDWSGPTLITSPIIHRGSALPASYEQAYSAVHDEQENAMIHVLQGEHEQVDRNHSIGQFKLRLKDPSGERAKINVRFDLSLSGTLKVTARQVGNDKAEELTINNALNQFQAEHAQEAAERLDQMFDAADDVSVDDNDRSLRIRPDEAHDTILAPQETVTDARDEEDEFADARTMLRKAQTVAAKVSGEDAEDLVSLAERLEQAIGEGDHHSVAELCDELDDVLFYVNQ